MRTSASSVLILLVDSCPGQADLFSLRFLGVRYCLMPWARLRATRAASRAASPARMLSCPGTRCGARHRTGAMEGAESGMTAGSRDLGPDAGGSPAACCSRVWQGAEQAEAALLRAGGDWWSPCVVGSTLAGLDLATVSLNPLLSGVSTSLLNLLHIAGLHHILVITWTWDWLLWFRYTLTKRNPLIFLYSCLAVFSQFAWPNCYERPAQH